MYVSLHIFYKRPSYIFAYSSVGCLVHISPYIVGVFSLFLKSCVFVVSLLTRRLRRVSVLEEWLVFFVNNFVSSNRAPFEVVHPGKYYYYTFLQVCYQKT